MEKYIDYKTWWLDTQVQYHVCDDCYKAEKLFEQHVNALGLYGLLEILSEW
jgi:hypothetical protein